MDFIGRETRHRDTELERELIARWPAVKDHELKVWTWTTRLGRRYYGAEVNTPAKPFNVPGFMFTPKGAVVYKIDRASRAGLIRAFEAEVSSWVLDAIGGMNGVPKG